MILKHLRFQHLKNIVICFWLHFFSGFHGPWLSQGLVSRLQIGELLLDGRLCCSKLLKRQISGAPKEAQLQADIPASIKNTVDGNQKSGSNSLTCWGRLVVVYPNFWQGIIQTSQVVVSDLFLLVFTLQRSTLKDATGSALLNLLAHLLLTLFQTTLVHLHIDFVIDLAWPNSFISFMRLRLSLRCC